MYLVFDIYLYFTRKRNDIFPWRLICHFSNCQLGSYSNLEWISCKCWWNKITEMQLICHVCFMGLSILFPRQLIALFLRKGKMWRRENWPATIWKMLRLDWKPVIFYYLASTGVHNEWVAALRFVSQLSWKRFLMSTFTIRFCYFVSRFFFFLPFMFCWGNFVLLTAVVVHLYSNREKKKAYKKLIKH